MAATNAFLDLPVVKNIKAGQDLTGSVMQAPAAEQMLLTPQAGNIRELRNTRQNASLLTKGRSFSLDHLFERSAPKSNEAQSMNGTRRDCFSERDYIVHALDLCRRQTQLCAISLGISRKRL